MRPYQKILVKLAWILVLLGGLWLVFEWDQSQISVVENRARQEEPVDASPQTIKAKHAFAAGEHTLSGKLNLPTPCHELEYETIITQSYPEQITINFKISPPAVDVICIQVVDEREFTIEFAASAGALILAKLNGHPVELLIDNQ
ncbi:MAG: hypothetical protein A3J48_02210 [Candidatus Doudnabacteria bacterium RIFCSPHIGHO2_02_FULL_46_11]|uniref:Uncharacterized protein n=1 Tax=Candidatus Doudnabacteria bacterium RIFCSPHIGHO2_02_FULL_46_11 TaxID=1817832 RepID=A0A1F5P531_9BACT|nr:MAG: hypothetical protein A3J48_02210 [Candidatus Doudnabacteria bacterium RIFCSPHIGHO2_02_FULL_46_11]